MEMSGQRHHVKLRLYVEYRYTHNMHMDDP
jgi:hypothetical protein